MFRKARSKFAINGVSDILGCLDGKLVALEVKTPERRKNVSDDQQRFIEHINKEGGIAGVVCSIDDVDELLGFNETSSV